MDKIIQAHNDKAVFKESVIVPEHVDRKESPLFKSNKTKLRNDGHYKCWVCENTENLEVHHYLCEWSMENACDLDKLKEVAELFDVYGYAKKYSSKPITSVDDIRNLMVLCSYHHKETYTGVHNLTFSTWILQKIGKSGAEIVVDEDKISAR
jgi:hypothetical protein